MKIRPAIRLTAIIGVALIFLTPLWWVTISAFRPESDIFAHMFPINWEFMFPRVLSFDNFVQLTQSDFSRAIFNSCLVAALTIVIGLLICASGAFALAVIDFPYRNAVFALVVVGFLIPFDAIALPLFEILRGYNLQNTYTGLVLPGVGSGLAVFMLRQFFLGIPKELREAAMIDGMSWFQIFWRVYLPLSPHALVGAAMILFVFQWHAYLWPLLIAPAPDHKVASVAIAQFSTTFETRYGLMFAGAFIMAAIPMMLLLLSQRYLRPSVSSSGGKE